MGMMEARRRWSHRWQPDVAQAAERPRDAARCLEGVLVRADKPAIRSRPTTDWTCPPCAMWREGFCRRYPQQRVLRVRQP
jgi:hypothetical protein